MMGTRIILLAALVAFSGLFSVHAAADSAACAGAVTQLEAHLRTPSLACKSDKDCKGYYYRMNTCKPAVILPYTHATADFMTKLEIIQRDVKILCTDIWANENPCMLAPYKAVCVNSLCAQGK